MSNFDFVSYDYMYRAKDRGGVASRRKAPPTQVFMDKRIGQLEAMLEERDKEDSKKLRALQQRYNAMEVRICKGLRTRVG